MSDNSKGKQIETEDSRRAENMKKWKNVMESTDLQDVLVSSLGHFNALSVMTQHLVNFQLTLHAT